MEQGAGRGGWRVDSEVDKYETTMEELRENDGKLRE
jgi:hypothetical protein